MALQQTRVIEVAAAIAQVSNELARVLARVNQVLEHNSDQAIDWSMPAPKTFTAATATDVLTATAHGMANGQKVRLSNAGGALPAGLLAGTDYYVVNAAANTFQVSTGVGGAAATFTTDGTGTHTCQPVPNYMDLESNGNLKDKAYTPAAVSNAIGSLDQVRRLLTNQAATTGDHLGNLNQLASPLA